MKKFLCLFLALLMVLSFGTLAAFAADAGPSLGSAQHVSDSDITLDAQNSEPAWANALTLPIGFAYQPSGTGNSDVSGSTVSFLWSDTAIYAYYAIHDASIIAPTSDTQNSTPYMCDSVELMVDVPDIGSTTASNGGLAAFQIRVDRTGFKSSWYATTAMADGSAPTIYGTDCDSIFSSAERSDDANKMYYVELKLPLSGLTAGAKVGLQVQINDEVTATPGEDHNVYNLTASDPAGSWDCDKYGYITLDATSAVPATTAAPDTTAAPAATDAAAPAAPSNPTTGDNGVIAIVLVAVAALGAVFVTGKAASKKRG